MTADILAFLGGKPRRIAVFEAVEALIAALGESELAVTKSQISWGNPKKFAFLSLPLHIAHSHPECCMILTFGLDHRLDHSRIFQAVEPYPNRWTHHVILTAPGDVDAVVGSFLAEAYAFSKNKVRRRNDRK